MNKILHNSVLYVNLEQLRRNVRTLLGELEGKELVPVLKGNAYGLGLEGPEDPVTGGLLSSLSGRGYGPFHHCYVLKLWGIDPEAERVRLDYGPADPLFSFSVDLKEGAA